MRFGLFGSAQANSNDLPPESGQGFRDYLDLNVEAEALGFHSTFLVEHHFTGWNQVSATLMLLTCVAMRTTTLRVGSAVIVLPWHNPVLLAEQAATLDLVSGGRLDFGIGKGYRHSEFHGFQIPPEEADARFEEAVEVITRVVAVARSGSPIAAGSGTSRTSWSSRRRRSSRIRRSGSRPRARRRSGAPPRAASISFSTSMPRSRRSASGSRSTAPSARRMGAASIRCRSTVARQLYVADSRADAEAMLARQARLHQAHRRRVARARPQAAARTCSPMRTPPAALRPMRSTARPTRSARSLRR